MEHGSQTQAPDPRTQTSESKGEVLATLMQGASYVRLETGFPELEAGSRGVTKAGEGRWSLHLSFPTRSLEKHKAEMSEVP